MMINRSFVDGPIQVPIYGPPEIDPVSGETTRPVIGWVSGAHYNVAESAMTPELRAYEVEPATPAQVFAGDDPTNATLTAFLSFPDSATAEAALIAAGLATE